MVAPGELYHGPKHHPGAVRIMRLAKVYRLSIDNALVGDLFDSTGMGFYRSVRFVAIGGGDGNNAVHLPTVPSGGDTEYKFDLAPEVIVAFSEGSRPRAFILGVLPHVADNLRINRSDEETKDDEAVIDFNGARIVWTSDGNLKLDVTHNHPNSWGHVRVAHRKKVSSGTQTLPSDERLLLGRAFATSPDSWIIADLLVKVNELGAQVQALTTAVKLLSSAGTALPTVVPPAPPLPTDPYRAAVIVADRGLDAYAYESPDPPGDEHLSAIFHVSEVSEDL